MLNAGKKIAIVVGAGARGARAEVELLAETLGAPVAKAYLGKDVLTDDSPYTTGGMGVFGTSATQEVFQNCDTLLMVGSSFPYIAYLPKPEGVRGVQIDLNPARIGLRFPVEVGLVGDARETLHALQPHLTRSEDRSFLQSAQEGMQKWRELLHTRETSDQVPMRPQVFAAALNKALSEDAVICGDCGQNTFWLTRHVHIKGTQQFSGTGTLATMASGLPYALGAQAAYPGRQVVAFVGDGGFTMLMGEIATAVKYQLPVKIFIAKNNALGMIRWEQMMFLGNPEYGVELQDIDFVKVAEACGATGLRVERPDEVDAIVAQALQMPGPVVVEAIVDPFEPLMPGVLKPEQAEHYAEALKKGTPNADRIGLTLFREAAQDPANRQALEKALDEQVPELRRASQHLAAEQIGADADEPQETLDAARAAAPERP